MFRRFRCFVWVVSKVFSLLGLIFGCGNIFVVGIGRIGVVCLFFMYVWIMGWFFISMLVVCMEVRFVNCVFSVLIIGDMLFVLVVFNVIRFSFLVMVFLVRLGVSILFLKKLILLWVINIILDFGGSVRMFF